MTTPASGDADSPIAKRGCAPRSRSATRNPSRRAIIASSEPPNPEPTMARSDSSGAVTQNRDRNLLRHVHALQPCGAVLRAVAGIKPLEIPQIGEHASASGDDA